VAENVIAGPEEFVWPARAAWFVAGAAEAGEIPAIEAAKVASKLTVVLIIGHPLYRNNANSANDECVTFDGVGYSPFCQSSNPSHRLGRLVKNSRRVNPAGETPAEATETIVLPKSRVGSG